MKRSHLHSAHTSLGAKMVEFADWELPISYQGEAHKGGTLFEHSACRNGVAVFDVSHLARVFVRDAADYLQWRLTNDLKKISEGQAQYTHILEEDGSVLDDLICADLGGNGNNLESRHLLVINAANHSKVLEVLKSDGIKIESSGIEGAEESEEGKDVFLAVQGPGAKECLKKVLQKTGASWAEKNQVDYGFFEDEEIMILGTGYTGEAGVECVIPGAAAEGLFFALVEAGAVPAGLGARDLLRLEAGYPLHGHELGKGITPLQAQLEWVISWNKGDFFGREALAEEKEIGPRRLLWGLITPDEKRPIRAGMEIQKAGRKIGEVTSGNYSPVLGCAIGMGLIESSNGEGDKVELAVKDSQKPDSVRIAEIRKINFLG